MNRIQSFSLAASLLILSACSSTQGYTGPSRSSDEVALVRAWGVALVRVNEISISDFSSSVEVLPGKNIIELTINASNFNAGDINDQVYTLIMQAEAGKEYAITGKRGDARLCAWLIDPDTGSPSYQSHAGCITRK